MNKIAAKSEKMCNTLNDFLNRNKDYTIEIYLISTDTDFIMGKFLVPVERNYDCNGENGYRLSWNGRNSYITISYNEVIACYEEHDEFGSQTVHVIMKNGMMFDFECCGVRM